ncbi:MAG: DUF3570 domain-containing protein [Flavobacteriales bacterium]
MKKLFLNLLVCGCVSFGFSQQSDSTQVFKKRVLENIEVDFMSSYYSQDGNNASVTGGIGTEKLTDVTPNFTVSIPLNDDDVLTIDAGISAYSSASSSNVGPFDSRNGTQLNASPWVESSGESSSDAWSNISGVYSHSSDDRNTIISANVSLASEYDYNSFGFGGGITKLYNKKNTEVGAKVNIFIDSWSPVTPTELRSNDAFSGFPIYNADGNLDNTWSPHKTDLVTEKGRNTYSGSFSFSQILSKNMQLSLFMDVIQQSGWLANPMQRVYFQDKADYFVGNPDQISGYLSPSSRDVFMLADDIERLPDTRLKIPIGARLNYYINENLTLRTYYRFYSDDWGVSSNTIQAELPIKLGNKFAVIPSYRYNSQSTADYFAPFNEHESTDEFYTSDYDLSKFTVNQYGLGLRYTDVLTNTKVWRLGLKSVNVKYSYYDRSTGLTASIISFGVKFVVDK